jgi:hypothetical protein
MDLPISETYDSIPKDIQYIIASYVIPTIYRLVDGFNNNIHWDDLCYNRHPGMIPLIDAYFERCLTIQSHLDLYMLERLSKNPTALPLLEKYKYHLIQGKIEVDWNTLCKDTNPTLERFDSLYQNPDIFEVDSVSTKKAHTKFVTEIFK